VVQLRFLGSIEFLGSNTSSRAKIFSLSSPNEEQRYLILECKVGIFKDVVHQDDEFAHDGRERNLDWVPDNYCLPKNSRNN